jgi:hypothetical protein
MPYPTDVTKPRLGVEAFEENDAASQLAQAAFLLLVGHELRRSRERVMSPRVSEIRNETLDEDAAQFKIPHIVTEGRRFRFREALAEEKMAAQTLSVRRKDRLHPASKDLAIRLQNAPSDRTAAALLGVCIYRPDPIVRTAAAAAGFEITAEPARLIAILAKATRDRDPLARDLAATALARVRPEHSALRRLAPRSRRGTRKTRAHTSLLVHGTFARNDAWWQPGGDFHSYLLANVLPDLYTGADRFDWSGNYSDAARLIAASELQAWISNHNVTDPLIMGHSHGANVILLATQLGVTMREAVLLSCPVHWPQYAPDFSRVGKVVSIRVHLDLVILADGGGQRFSDLRIKEHVLPVWFNHSATHDPAVWGANDVPPML